MRYIFFFTSLILIGCNNNSSPTEPTTEAEIQKIEAIYPYDLSLPDTKVGVYPLGDPRLGYYDNYERDQNGVILNDGWHHPGVISKLALGNYRAYIKAPKDSYIQEAMIQTDWLANNIVCTNHVGYWPHQHELNLLITESPFPSAMSNGLGIAALIQMLPHTDDKDKYLDTIGCALNAFAVDIENGGVSSFDGKNELWFEEYATTARSKVLNGSLFGLGGVWMAKEYLNSELAGLLFKKFSENVVSKISLYDYDFTSLYHLLIIDGKNVSYPRVTHSAYNQIHVSQLLWLYSLTKKQTLLEYAKKFVTYEDHEFLGVYKNGTLKKELIDRNISSTPVYIRPSDDIRVTLNEGHTLRKLVIHYSGHYTSLPNIAVVSSNSTNVYQATEVKLHEGGKHLTSIGIYEVTQPELDFNIEFEYQLDSNMNKVTEIEVITDDKDAYLKKILQKNIEAHGWPNISLPND